MLIIWCVCVLGKEEKREKDVRTHLRSCYEVKFTFVKYSSSNEML